MFVGFGSLSQLNQAGVFDKAGLQPIVDSFPGSTYTEKLPAAYEQARQVLSKYTSTFTYDANAAAELYNQIDTWFNTHQDMIAEYMKQPATATVPQQIALVLDAKKAQQFIVAGFASAAKGLGPWASGFVFKNAGAYPGLTQDIATDDAKARLAAFASIIKFENEGVLQQIFHPQAPLSGLGFWPLVVEAVVGAAPWIAVTIVGALAVYKVYQYAIYIADQNNRVFREICDKASASGDKLTEMKCLEYAAPKSATGLSEAMQTLALFAGVGALLYVGAVHVLPAMKKQRSAAT